MATPDQSTLDRLERRRDGVVNSARQLLEARQAAGVRELDDADATRFRSMQQNIAELSEHIDLYRGELERVGTVLEGLAKRATGGTERRGNTAAPLDFDQERLRDAYQRVAAGEAVRLTTRAFTSATPLLPAELAPYVTFPVHEGRILDHVPAIGIESPSIEVIQVQSVTGQASTVAEGALKAEIVPVSTPLTITAKKIAAHVGLSTEALQDFDLFVNAVRIELQRLVIDCENDQILYGDGTGTNLNGFTTTPGILTFDASTASQGLDAVEEAITALRVGNALATADLLILNPTTWSSIRRTKDSLGRYLVQPDPTTDAPDSLWGVPVVATTVCNPAEGVLLDTTKFGRSVVREPLSMRIGWANDDLVRNILRTVAEQRLNLAVERPAAVCWIKSLPIVTPSADDTTTTKSRK